MAALETEPKFSETCCNINGLYALPSQRNAQEIKEFKIHGSGDFHIYLAVPRKEQK